MKTLKIENAEIEEIIIRPSEAIPISVSYKLFDDMGELITVKRVNIARSEAPTQLNNIASRILQLIISKEGL